MTVSGNFERSFLTLKQIFWKTKTFFKQLENGFLVESTKIENTSLSYKTATSESIDRSKRMMSTKWTYHKNEVLPVTALFFWKCYFSLRISYKELIWCTNERNAHIRIFCRCLSFYIWRCLWSSTLYVHCSGHCLNLVIARSCCLTNLRNSFVYSIPPVVAFGINERSVRINSCKQRPF